MPTDDSAETPGVAWPEAGAFEATGFANFENSDLGFRIDAISPGYLPEITYAETRLTVLLVVASTECNERSDWLICVAIPRHSSSEGCR